MSVLLVLAIIIAVIAVACAVKAVRVTATKTHTGVVAPTVDTINPDCMEAVVMILAYTKASLKEERLNVRRARARAWHINNCASKEAARKARKEAMGHISAAQRKAENKKKANQFMVGKSWQEAISALYNEGKLVSVRKHGDIKCAVLHTKSPRTVRGVNMLTVSVSIQSIAQKDEWYKITHPVSVKGNKKIASTWRMGLKVVSKERLAFLAYIKELKAQEAHERYLEKAARWAA